VLAPALALALCAACIACGAAQAAPTFEWNAGEAASLWSEDANWAAGEAPTPTLGPVNLVFPLSACESGAQACSETRDDVAGLEVGTLTLGSRLIAGTEPLAPPPAEPPPTAYTVSGDSPLPITGGIDSPATVEGAGSALAGTAAPIVTVPLVLAAANTWTLGPAPGSALDVLGPVSGAQPLSVSLAAAAHLELGGETEVGPVTITGAAYSTVWLGEGAADLDGHDASPVTLVGSSLEHAVGTVGPLTARAADVRLGRPGGGGVLEVAGAAGLLEGTRLFYALPGPEEGGPPEQLHARGHVELGGAQLVVYEGCPAIGSSFTPVRADGGVSGLVTDEAGEPLLSGETLAGSSEGCGQSRPGADLRIEYGPDTVVLTAVVPPSGTAPVGAASNPPPKTAGAVEAYTASQRSQLAADLARARSLRRSALLRRSGARLAVAVPTAGTLTLLWTARAHHRNITLASGHLRLGGPGAGAARGQRGILVVRLTKQGRALLERSRRVTTRISETFAGLVVPRYTAAAAAVVRR
jgi:hypothetical protein